MSTTELLLWAALALVLLIVLVAAARPDRFRVERSLAIQASPERIHTLINDFHQWATWSPWEKLDPDMERNYSGPGSGKGAMYAWSSKGKAGVGRMEIMQSEPQRILIRLEFIKPFAACNTAEFTFTAQGETTQVLWAMYGPSPFISRLMGLVFNIDRMVGRDFEAGLGNMQRVLSEGE
ncbi:MAG: SRPBCC family protein, partial [Rhodoferax sp.]|nr:SRPBCC family protein [Rhodoferax sp.]